MATKYWVGGTNGNFGTATNWLGGVAPVNSDTVIFDRGSVDVDAGHTTGLTGITMIGTSGYTGRIGVGTPLSIALASLQWKNSGSLSLTGNITAGKVRCRTGSFFNYAGGTATSLFIDRTQYAIGGSAVVTRGRAYRSNGSDLNNGTAFTRWEMDGGNHTSHRKGVFVLRNSATLKAKSDCELDDGTFIGNNSVIEYTSEKTIASGDTVEVSSTGMFTAASAPTQFTWDGVLATWPGASINLITASGAVTPGTYTRYGFDDTLEAIPIP